MLVLPNCVSLSQKLNKLLFSPHLSLVVITLHQILDQSSTNSVCASSLFLAVVLLL